jgi:hypothetical protein
MFKRKFLIEVEFSQEEMQAAADVYDVSIEQLTDTQIAQTLANALGEEFEGITILPLDLTPQAQS